MRTRLSGIGARLPERVVDNEHFVKRLDTSDAWIVRRTGIRERRWLGPDEPLALLAADACRDALADAGIEPDQVDEVIVATITPDHITPGLGPELVHELGLGEIAASDINAACAGFLYALEAGAAMIESGRARCVLVCAAEALSRLTDFDDRSTAILFGDGAGAAVLEPAGDHEPWPAFVRGADGDKAALLYADPGERALRMSGQEVFRHAVPRMADALRESLARARLDVDDLALVIAHQANARIIDAVAADLGVPADRVMVNVDRFANTSSATIPLALWEADRTGRIRPGDPVAMVAFGAGFVWAAGVIPWKEPLDGEPTIVAAAAEALDGRR